MSDTSTAWTGGVTVASTSPFFTRVPSRGKRPDSGGASRPPTEDCTTPLALGSGMIRPGSSTVRLNVSEAVTTVRTASTR